jgi:hypothetical protein
MEEKVESAPKRPVAGMKALGLGMFCAFGVFLISIGLGMSSVLAGKKLLVRYSSDVPLEFKYERASEELSKKAFKKIIAYVEGASKVGKLEFSLGVDELNSLIAYRQELSELKNCLEFDKLEQDLFAAVSFPLERIDGLQEIGQGKFLNGRTHFAVYLKKKEFKVQMMEFLQEEKPLQIDSISALMQRNLLRHLDDYEESEEKFNLVKDVVFKGGRIFFRNWKEKRK